MENVKAAPCNGLLMERSPSSLYLQCSECREETRHRILRGRYEGKKNRVLNLVAECSVCNCVHHEVLRDEKEVVVPVMISDGKETISTDVSLGEDTVLKEGEEIYTPDGLRNIITAIEAGGRRLYHTRAGEVDTLWLKRMEEVVVKFSVNKGSNTISREVKMHYDEEVSVGEILVLDGRDSVVHRIKTADRIVYDGSVRAEEIVRVYARVVKKKWS